MLISHMLNSHTHADLPIADLIGANLSYANLIDTNFSGTDLTGAVFANSLTDSPEFIEDLKSYLIQGLPKLVENKEEPN